MTKNLHYSIPLVYLTDETDVSGHEVFAKKLESLDMASLSNTLATEALVSGRLDNTVSVDNSEHSSANAHQVVLHRYSINLFINYQYKLIKL